MVYSSNLLEVVLVVIPAIALLGLIVNRTILKRGIGVRSIQFTTVSLVIPIATLLALRGHLTGETVGAIFAGLAGYILGNVAKFDDRVRDVD
jgi:hypothetical protein